MKCVKMPNGVIMRVRDDHAHHLVIVTKEAVYVSKKEWKDLRNKQGSK